MSKFYSISELSKILNLINPSNKKPLNYIIRYWEKQFKQIKPKKINNRRYYSVKQVEFLKLIKFLLKNKGMTISGVKNILNSKINKLDDYNSDSLKAEYFKNKIKNKSENILGKIKRLKNYGKKNSFKS
jgi:DNA-binding transcriptional MerR regulator